VNTTKEDELTDTKFGKN